MTTTPTPATCPECRDGKCRNCVGQALHEATDEIGPCMCACRPVHAAPTSLGLVRGDRRKATLAPRTDVDAARGHRAADQRGHITALTAERDALAKWKAEALPVLEGLQELGRALGLPLGERITGPAALEAARTLVHLADGEDRQPPAPECNVHLEQQHRDGKPPWCRRCGWRRGRPAVPAAHLAPPSPPRGE